MLGIGYTNYIPAAAAAALANASTVLPAGIKRSSDELLSPYTNSLVQASGRGMSPVQTDLLTNEAKKAKLEPSLGRPSRVVHLRNVPSDATEQEILSIGMPFGAMTNLVLAKKKNQALLEMADVQSAQTLVNYYTERPPHLRGRMVYIQFSNHDQLKTDIAAGGQPMQVQPAAMYAALQQQQQQQQFMTTDEEPKTVLRVIIEQMVCAVSIDILKGLFGRFGPVLKIITFNKNSTFQALVQFADANSAQAAKMALNGQSLAQGGCTLRIDYSHLQNLNVKYNNDKSRDFTNPTLPASDDPVGGPGPAGSLAGAPVQQPNHQPQTVTIDGVLYSIGALPGATAAAANKMSPTAGVPMDPAEFGLFAGPGGYIDLNGRHVITAHSAAGLHPSVISSSLSMHGLPPGAFAPQMATAFGAPSPFGGLPLYADFAAAGPTAIAPPHFLSAPGGAVGLQQAMPGFQTLALPGAITSLASGMPLAGGRGDSGMAIAYQSVVGPGGLTLVAAAAAQASAILLVSNLNEEKVSPDALFTLFGVYGDVIRVKIMFNKKDNALVQYIDPNQARVALMYLDKVTLWGKKIKVTLSKHTTVQMPKEGQPDAGLTKEYLNSPLHRYKKPLSKNYNNIFPPSATLHLSNIPPTTSETDLKRLFAEFGEILAFKFFQKDHKMALIQMGTVEQAVEALVALHNHQLAETTHLRVSFSKSTISPAALAAAAAAASSASASTP